MIVRFDIETTVTSTASVDVDPAHFRMVMGYPLDRQVTPMELQHYLITAQLPYASELGDTRTTWTNLRPNADDEEV